MLAYFESTLSWPELLKRTYKELMDDDALGQAAQLAYYFFLAVFPAILCVIALASFLPLQNFTDEIVSSLDRFAPAEMLSIIRDQMVRLAQGNDGGILTLGLLGAVWSSSAAMVAMISAMNRAYEIDEGRPWWKVRATAILLTVGFAVFIVIAFGLIVAGPQAADWAAARLGFAPAFALAWKILQWPLAFALVVTGIGLVYYFAPDAEQDWVWITPGALIATVLWVIGSLAFRFYVVNFGNYEATYGAITGVILLMLWFYVSGLALLIGAEASAEIEHASPWGKAAGEKIPGQKKKLGSAAGRAWRERGGAPAPPVSSRQPAGLQVMLPQPSFVDKAGAAIVLFLRWRSKVKP